MKFTKHQKEIISKIASGEIYDIVSYLKAFNLTTFRKLDKTAIEEKFKSKENGATYKIPRTNFSKTCTTTQIIAGFPVEMPTPIYDFEEVPASLEYSSARMEIQTCNNEKYTFDYTEGINFTNSFSDIKNFLTIWQYLKAEGLVLEVDKKVQQTDYEIFLEYKPIKEIDYEKKVFYNTHTTYIINGIDNELSTLTTNRTLPKDFRDFIDYFFEYNKSNEIICSQFIDKQIIANSDLDLFIKQKFRTREQVNNIANLIPAYIALALTLIITIYQEWDGNNDMERIMNQLSVIESQLEENVLTSDDLEYIETQLETISNSKYSDSAILEKFDVLMELIKENLTSQN